jgi:ribosomal protein S6
MASGFDNASADSLNDEQTRRDWLDYERELFDRATVKWRRTREEQDVLRLIKGQPAEVQAYYKQRMLERRMAYLREKDRQAYWERIQPEVDPSLRSRLSRLLQLDRSRDRDR